MLKKEMPNHATAHSLTNKSKIYKPSKKVIKNATVKDWKKVRADSLRNPVKFWEEAARDLKWFKPWDIAVQEKKKNFFQWFVGGKCNLVSNALDRHMGTPVEKKTAIIWENDKGSSKKLTYRQLNTAVCKLANGLKSLGIKRR